ncbi:MAG: hypothetical protein HY231_07870 [Acidobacteria bacterium]|nr:hypothetical protein [Acidobacteriota bacterium]
MNISLRWLLTFLADLYADLPDDLNVRLLGTVKRHIKLLRLQAEADELWSFVARKTNQQGVWMAIDVESRQVLAFYVGDRNRQSARQLWKRIPTVYRQLANFDTEDGEAYKGVIPKAQHQVCAKSSGRSNNIERFTCSLRQRVSRLVRETLCFSKELEPS